MLALAAAGGRPFNSDLYVVAATVIPVYFAALMLPGAVLARYAVWAQREHIADIHDALRHQRAKGARSELLAKVTQLEAWAASLNDPERAEQQKQVQALRRVHRGFARKRRPGAYAFGFVDHVRRFPVVLVLIFGAYSEIQAVLALDHRQASPNEHQWVLLALVGMPVVAAVPVIQRIVIEGRKESEQQRDLAASVGAKNHDCSDFPT